MIDWKDITLAELGTIITGKTPSKNNPQDWGDVIPFVTPSDYGQYFKRAHTSIRMLSTEGKDRLSGKILPKNSVMVTCIGSDMGKVAMNAVPVITNQQINSIIPNESYVCSDFLYYSLVDSYEILKSYGRSGTAVPIVNKGDFSKITIKIPRVSVQKAIAEVLSSLDDKIDLLHRQNDTLEALAEALFKEWFINQADDDWVEGKLPDEFDFTMGQSPPGTSYNEHGAGLPMFQGNADFTMRFPKNRVYTTEPNRLAKPYDTLISVRAPVGEQNMAREECCIGRGVAAFRYKKDSSYSTYAYYKMKSLMDEIKQFNETGTVFGSISKRDFEGIDVLIPPVEMVQNFEREAGPLDQKLIKNCKEIETLEQLRDTLLPKLISGEVRVAYEDNQQTSEVA